MEIDSISVGQILDNLLISHSLRGNSRGNIRMSRVHMREPRNRSWRKGNLRSMSMTDGRSDRWHNRSRLHMSMSRRSLEDRSRSRCRSRC